MANFATFQAAQDRAQAKVDDGTWVDAFGMLDKDGIPKVRFERKCQISSDDTAGGTVEGMNTSGAWDETRSDTAV